MTRTLLLKLLYAAVALALGGLALVIVTTIFKGHEKFGAVLVGLVLLVPGRLQGFFFRSLFRGRHLLDENQPQPALEQLRAFIEQLNENPWQKRLIWLS